MIAVIFKVLPAKWRITDYRLRIAGVLRDYGMTDRDQVPADSIKVHDASSPH